jgi:peptide/nickel transport system ATP-binding protein
MTVNVPLLEVRDLTVEFSTRRGLVKAVQHVDICVARGETLAIVGESGSGKSVTSYAVMRILDRAGRIAEGSVVFAGVDVCRADEFAMRDLRGREISMIFQNPRAALNPIRKVGRQIEDVLRQHAQAGAKDSREMALSLLERVRIAQPSERYEAYPFELSGGMCQRVVIALALACRPQLLIADEPTTGLDVTTQKTVMDLVVELPPIAIVWWSWRRGAWSRVRDRRPSLRRPPTPTRASSCGQRRVPASACASLCPKAKRRATPLPPWTR